MKTVLTWLTKWRVITVMGPFIALWVFCWGVFAQFLNNGKPIKDDPSALYADAMMCVPIFFCIMLTRLSSGMNNNSLTTEEYRSSAWQDKLVDNIPEVVTFIVCVIFFMHSS